ncbi:MAG: hypothetical protein FWD33_00860 [Alphaproteobacteria bacterium]|nr:hypothetical protein [Alphaproteobacteria bacterium]
MQYYYTLKNKVKEYEEWREKTPKTEYKTLYHIGKTLDELKEFLSYLDRLHQINEQKVLLS